MCSVLLLHRVFTETPLAVYFVRDEALERPGRKPEWRPGPHPILAPRDPRAGGTWLGWSPAGFVVGLVNRKGDPVPPEAKSRGQLLIEILSAEGWNAAVALAAESSASERYGGCRLFLGNGKRLWWVDRPAGGLELQALALEPGAWLMRHVHPPTFAPEDFVPKEGETTLAWLRRAHRDAAAHRPSKDPFCRHGEAHGSVDTAFIALDVHGQARHLRYRGGGPCAGELEDFAPLLQRAPAPTVGGTGAGGR